MVMPVKMAIFDVDGTLVDSRSSILRALIEAATILGHVPPSYDEARQIVGLSLPQAIAQMRPALDEVQVEAYCDEYKDAFLRFHAEPDFHEALYEGADAHLRHLKAEGWLLGMATGKSRRGINRNREVFNWHGLFDAAFCADDGPSKPHPHMLELNMKALGVEPQNCIMIGDTTHDIDMANEAKVCSIAVSWGFHTVDELQHARPHKIVHDFAQLKLALDQFANQTLETKQDIEA